MKVIKTYPTEVEANLDRLALEGAEIPAVVVGIGAGMEGGIQGVKLLVHEDLADEALQVLDRRPPP
jgi:hypothetical protein